MIIKPDHIAKNSLILQNKKTNKQQEQQQFHTMCLACTPFLCSKLFNFLDKRETWSDNSIHPYLKPDHFNSKILFHAVIDPIS